MEMEEENKDSSSSSSEEEEEAEEDEVSESDAEKESGKTLSRVLDLIISLAISGGPFENCFFFVVKDILKVLLPVCVCRTWRAL